MHDFGAVFQRLKESGQQQLAEMTASTTRELEVIGSVLRNIPVVQFAFVGFDALKLAAAGAKDFIVQQFSDPDSFTREFFRQWIDSWKSAFGEIIGAASDFISGLIDAISGAIAKFRELITLKREAASTASAGPTGAAGGGGGSGFASGGQVRGAGTGTSDSILARLSNGEFVINARATAEWRPVIELINSGRLRFNDFAQRFADGGLVRTAKTVFELPGAMLDAASEALSPRFAAGGQVATRAAGPVSALTLVLGGENFDGLTGPVDTISRLERAIRGKKLRSAGRPSPYEGR